MKYLYSAFITLTTLFSVSAQTFNGVGGPITDGNWQHDIFYCNVSGLPAVIDTNFGIEKVKINIAHTYDGDLSIYLAAPNGNYIPLANFLGGSNDNYTNTVFSNNVVNSINAASAPFTGTFAPTSYLSLLNDLGNPNGDWILYVMDNNLNDVGNVIDFSITFSNQPAKWVNFKSSNLPIISINTNFQNIIDEPKIIAQMGIISNGAGQRNFLTDSFNNYNNQIAIELHGNYSQTYPQQSYGFETLDAQDSVWDASLLGMPKEHEWILYAPYNDVSMMRNVLTYKLSREMGNFSSRSQFCELVINGEYRGVYALMEKIKRDDNRVSVKQLDSDDNAGDSLTGGYIFKVDWWAGNGNNGWWSAYDNIFIQYHYPKYPTWQQGTYLKSFVDSFETALFGANYTDPIVGYKKYINVTSFIDYMFLQEVSKNPDGYRASTYFNKEKITDGGKIKAGPQWDINYGYGNYVGCESQIISKWEFETYSCDQKVRWWNRLMTDTVFQNNVKCRWTWLRTKTLEMTYLQNYLDSMEGYLGEAQARHFQRWNLLGLGVVGSPRIYDATFKGAMNDLQKWLVDRIGWLDANMPGKCYNLSVEDEAALGAMIQVFPNPFNNYLDVNYFLNEETKVQIQLVDVLGRVIKSIDCGNKIGGDYNERISDFQQLSSGIYSIVVKTDKKVYTNKVVKE